jgi:hypothetical protein
MSISTEQTAFSLIYEVSPIILVDGLAQYFPGGILPITLITELFDIPGIENGEFFAHFKPISGGTLADWEVAEYPFASMQVAANAVIQQPLKISMMMVCPAQTGGGYLIKQAILTALQTAIQNHLLSGGSFTVITPAYTYTNCLLTSIRDITPSSDKQVQYIFQWDFVQPLITASGAQQVLGNLMNKFENGLPTPSNLTWNETAPNQVPPYQSLGAGESIIQ